MRGLLAFPAWVDPSHEDLAADVMTGKAASAVAIGLDLLADEMTEADVARCTGAIKDKALVPYLRAMEEEAFWTTCYHHWNAVINGGVGVAAVLLQDEQEAAPAALERARGSLGAFFKALGREGGWDEGLGFWGLAMRYLLLLAESLDNVNGDGTLYGHRGMDATGLFPVYFTPNGLPVSFGDRPIAPTWGVFYLLAGRFALNEIAWWLDKYAFRHDVRTSGYCDAGLALLFRPEDLPPEPEPALSPVKSFREIGWAALADRWPAPRLYAALKTGDLAAHHAQLDMNSLQLVADGELLLHDPGSPEFTREYLSPVGRHDHYEAQARSHNTVTLAGREHRIDAVGAIVEAESDTDCRWATGQAGGALGEGVTFLRHVVMTVEKESEPRQADRMIIVVDEIRNAAPEEIDLAWHTGGELVLQSDRPAGRITGRAASLHFALGATCPFELQFSQRTLGTRGEDRCWVVHTEMVRQAVLATAFCPVPVGAVELIPRPDGLDIEIGRLRLDFTADRGVLHLNGVRRG
jgi:hypothetical protein